MHGHGVLDFSQSRYFNAFYINHEPLDLLMKKFIQVFVSLILIY